MGGMDSGPVWLLRSLLFCAFPSTGDSGIRSSQLQLLIWKFFFQNFFCSALSLTLSKRLPKKYFWRGRGLRLKANCDDTWFEYFNIDNIEYREVLFPIPMQKIRPLFPVRGTVFFFKERKKKIEWSPRKVSHSSQTKSPVLSSPD